MTPGAWGAVAWLLSAVTSAVAVVTALVGGNAFAAVGWAVAFLASWGAVFGVTMYEFLRRETGREPNPATPWNGARHRDGDGP